MSSVNQGKARESVSLLAWKLHREQLWLWQFKTNLSVFHGDGDGPELGMVLVSQEFKKICLPNPQIVGEISSFFYKHHITHVWLLNVDGLISFFPVIFSVAVVTYLHANVQDFLWGFYEILILITLPLWSVWKIWNFEEIKIKTKTHAGRSFCGCAGDPSDLQSHLWWRVHNRIHRTNIYWDFYVSLIGNFTMILFMIKYHFI